MSVVYDIVVAADVIVVDVVVHVVVNVVLLFLIEFMLWFRCVYVVVVGGVCVGAFLVVVATLAQDVSQL